MSAPVLSDADLRAAGYLPVDAASNRWAGGYCPGHGAYPTPGCVTCPPADHPLQVAEAERAARFRGDAAPAAHYVDGCAECQRRKTSGVALWDACEDFPPDCATCPGECHIEACRRPIRDTGSAPAGVLFAFLVCLLIGLAFVSVVVIGRAAMCDWHGPDSGISYCQGQR